MKRISKQLMTIVICVMTVFCLSISAFATADDAVVTCNKSLDAQIVQKWVAANDDNVVLDKTYKAYSVTGYSAKQFSISVDHDIYDKLTSDEKATANKEMTATVNSWGLSQEASQLVYDKLKDADLGISDSTLLTLIFAETKADLSSAMKLFSPFNSTLGLILGIGVIIIIVLLIASTVFDLVYLGLPMARVAMDSKAEGQDKPKPFGVSYDAVQLVEEYEKGGDKGGHSGNIYFAYLKRRIITYIILAICILYLVSGQIAGLIGWLMDLVSGFGA